MKIQDMFEKDITRDLEGVIVVGEGDQANVKQELEEYVITRELRGHFREFFENYKKGIVGKTTKTGVWISGFFGSGKSHFLKMLSYILENREVDGKCALQYLIDNDQIKDEMLLADMQLAANTPTDVMLFNIDSKSEQSGKYSNDAIVMVFLKVFNEMLGYYGSMPYVAELERQLSEDGRYEEFMQLFEEEYGKPWKESRNRFDFIQDTIVDVLSDMGYMSESAARNWCEKAIEPFHISIENFAKMVKAYIDKKGNNHHVVFLADEVGQFIGNDSQMMLNLQTLREELGKECQGKVWVVVTSQQDIDSITHVKGDDFSKIQGRFDTRLSLSSANVDEVIKERILRKTPVAAQTLRLLYGQKDTQLSNIIFFNDTAEMKMYTGEDNFADIYPFVPYQFHLLASVLTSIRTHGASGKHLSEGERSMLGMFKESAEAVKDESEGAIVPFYRFYDALESFLDAAHSRVIRQALDNKHINPDEAEDCFPVNVLKCLFLIKYVKEMENATLENITSLMISSVDDDRGTLSEEVEDALQILVKETLVQKHNNVYVFLTEEEQEIGREIENEQVEIREVIAKIAEMIYSAIFTDSRYKFPMFNGRYTFPFNQIVDNQHYKLNQGYEIGVRVLTPYTDFGTDETTLRMISGQGKEVLIVLPNDHSYIDETWHALKIEKYLNNNSSSINDRYEEIRNKKSREMSDCRSNAQLYLTEALKKADIYVNGDKVQISSKDVSLRINEALGRLVEKVYHKLYYIDTEVSTDSIRKLFTETNQLTLDLDNDGEPNKEAQNDLLFYIRDNSSIHTKTSMKTLKDKFKKAPYGYVDDDVEWLVAKLFQRGDIILTLSGEQVSIMNTSADELVRLLTKKEFVEKLMVEYRVKRSRAEIRNARDLLKELFDATSSSDDEDFILQLFQNNTKDLLASLKNLLDCEYSKLYPGRSVIESGISLLRKISQLTTPSEFYPKLLSMSDDLFEFSENYEPLSSFFGGEQQKIFDEALHLMDIYEDSKSYIVDDDLENIVASIQSILKNQKPFKDIPKLPSLLNDFRDAYSKVLDEAEMPVIATIEEEQQRVLDVLNTKSYSNEYRDHFMSLFAELLEKAKSCNNVTTLRSYADQAGVVKLRLLNQMDKIDADLACEEAEAAMKEQYDFNQINSDSTVHERSEPAVRLKTKNKRNISIKTITQTSSWRIESKDDIDKYLESLRRKLEQELDDETIINIEF